MNVNFDERKMTSMEVDPELAKPRIRHLETLEAERVLAVLDDVIRSMNMVAAFDCIIDDLEEFSFLLGRQLYQLFKTFGPIYVYYTELCIKILAAKGSIYSVCMEQESDKKKDVYTLPDDFWTASLDDLKNVELTTLKSNPIYTEEQIEEFKRQLPQLEEEKVKLVPQVQFYIRGILIAFRNNPVAVKCIMEHKDIWSIKRNATLGKMIMLMEQMREILLQRLLTSAQERDDKTRFLSKVHRKQTHHNEVIKELKVTLANLNVEKEKMICIMGTQIVALQRSMYEMEIDGKNEIHKLQSKTEREIKEMNENHETNKAKLLNDITEIKNRYNELVETNQENELNIRRKKWKLETETESWITKYDTEMAEYQLQYDKLKLEYDAEKASLAELQKRFEPLEKEYIQVLEERRIAKEKEEAERSEHEALVYWATVIQSFWRAWKARKAMRRNRRR